MKIVAPNQVLWTLVCAVALLGCPAESTSNPALDAAGVEDAGVVVPDTPDVSSPDELPNTDAIEPEVPNPPNLGKPDGPHAVPTAGGISIQPGVAISAEGVVAIIFAGNTAEVKDLDVWVSVDGEAPVSVSPDAPGARNEPAICALAGGGFVAAWSFDGQAHGLPLGVEAALISADGSVGKRFAVSTEVEGNHWLGHVGCDPQGGFVVTGVRTDTDDTTFGVFAQWYSADGSPEGGALAINPTPEGTQVQPVVAIAPNGEGVVVYEDSPTNEQYALSARRINAKGTVGDVFHVAGDATHEAKTPAVAINASGRVAYAGTVFNDVKLRVAPSTDAAPEPLELNHDGGGRSNPAVTFAGRPDVIGVIFLDDSGASGSRRVVLSLVGAGVPKAQPRVTVSDKNKLPPYPPAIAWGAGKLTVAWTERLDAGQFQVFTTTFAATP